MILPPPRRSHVCRSTVRTSTAGSKAVSWYVGALDSQKDLTMLTALLSPERRHRRLPIRAVHGDTLVHLCPGAQNAAPAVQYASGNADSSGVQNNGVIAITRCANRTAGRFCCMFLILFGVLGKISGVFLASACTRGPLPHAR